MAVTSQPPDDVETRIVECYGRVQAAQRALLAEIAAHDRAEGWRAAGAASEEAFLAARLGVGWRTAAWWVRAARALVGRPAVAEAFRSGALSEDQLRSLVEIQAATPPSSPLPPEGSIDAPAVGGAPPAPAPGGLLPVPTDPEASHPSPQTEDGHAAAATDEELLALAGRLSTAQLAIEAARRRRVSGPDARAAHRRRWLQVSYYPGQRRLSVRGQLFDDQAAAVWAALQDHAASCGADPVTGAFEPIEARHADGLVEMAHARLAGRDHSGARPALVVHGDVRLLGGGDGWAETSTYAPLAGDTFRRLACDCRLVAVAEDAAGHPVGVGRAQRIPPWWLAELVRRRDGGCRFPGCGRGLFTEIHHVAEWVAHAGRTDLPNLVTLCSRHHHALHEGGWSVRGSPDGCLTFVGPDGRLFETWPVPAAKVSPTGGRADVRGQRSGPGDPAAVVGSTRQVQPPVDPSGEGPFIAAQVALVDSG